MISVFTYPFISLNSLRDNQCNSDVLVTKNKGLLVLAGMLNYRILAPGTFLAKFAGCWI